MASTAATTNGVNEHDAEATARRTGGQLFVFGIQSRIVGDELA